MSAHLTDEILALGDPAGAHAGHLDACPACWARLATWSALRAASVTASDELTGAVRAPSFDALLGPVLASPGHLEIASPGLEGSCRSLLGLAAAQLRLIPRLLVPFTLVALAAAVVIAVMVRSPENARDIFGAAVSVTLLTGALSACARRTEPRNELLAVLPMGPVTVFAIRLGLVLSGGALLGIAASVAVVLAGGEPTLPQLVAGWFGQALLASACGVLGTVWRSPALGGGAALTIWGIGSLGSLSSGVVAEHLGSVVDSAWATTAPTIAAAVVLLAIAAWQVREVPIDPTPA